MTVLWTSRQKNTTQAVSTSLDKTAVRPSRPQVTARSGLYADYCLFYSLFALSVLVVYRAPYLVNQAFFASVLVLFLALRKDYLFFAFTFCLISEPGNLFTNLLESGQYVAIYPFIGFVKLTYFDLFLLFALGKALLRPHRSVLRFGMSLSVFFAYMLLQFVASMLLDPPESMSVLQLLRRLFVFTLFLTLPRLMNQEEHYRKFAYLLFPLVILFVISQCVEAVTGTFLETILSGSGYLPMADRDTTLRLSISNYEALLFWIFGFSLFCHSTSNTRKGRTLLLCVALATSLITIASSTRIWILAHALVWVGVAASHRKATLGYAVAVLAVIAVMVNVSVVLPDNDTVIAAKERLYGGLMHVRHEAGFEDASISARMHEGLPKLLSGIRMSPIVGLGFSEAFYAHECSDWGALNVLLQGGLLGLLVYLGLWTNVLGTLWRAAQSMRAVGNGGWVGLRVMTVYCLGLLAVDFSTISLAGYHVRSNRIFFFVVVLSFMSYYSRTSGWVAADVRRRARRNARPRT